MKVLITGGSGFLGLHVCKRLLAVGSLCAADDERREIRQLVLFDRGFGDVPEDPRVVKLQGDVTEKEVCEKLVDEASFMVSGS